MSVLLLDRDQLTTRHCSRFWTIFSCRNGIYSPLERALQYTAANDIYYYHPDSEYEKLATATLGIQSAQSHPCFKEATTSPLSLSLDDTFSSIIDSADLAPNKTLQTLGDQIEADLENLLASGDFSSPNLPEGAYVIGDPQKLYCHKEATIYPGTIINTEKGPVIIDAGAKVGKFSHIAGPAYIGTETQVDNCNIGGPTVIGKNCRVGGEIEETVFGDYSNKHHEGFLGHSFVGRWVNIGALATTSDLKNNYGTVHLAAPSQFAATGELERFNTGTNKFGSIISDCAKIAIGTMLNTGTIIDAGSNIFEKPVPKYVPPFAWGPSGKRYDLERFLKDCETIFARRGQAPSDALKGLVSYLWSATE